MATWNLNLQHETLFSYMQYHASMKKHSNFHTLAAAKGELQPWMTKHRVTRKGTAIGGVAFTKTSLHHLLTSVTYIGKIRHKTEVYDGEHEAIVPVDVFEAVQNLLARNGREGGRGVRNRYGALLGGLLRCHACDCAMSHSYTTRGHRRYRYYVCNNAQKSGWDCCPAPSIPAGEIEEFVVDQIKCIGQDPELIAETVRQMHVHVEDSMKPLVAEQASLRRQLQRDQAAIHKLVSQGKLDADSACRVSDLEERERATKLRLGEITVEMAALEESVMPDEEAAAALAAFDPVWESLSPRERVRLLQLLVERVDFDGQGGSVAVTFRPNGIRALEDFAEAAS